MTESYNNPQEEKISLIQTKSLRPWIVFFVFIGAIMALALVAIWYLKEEPAAPIETPPMVTPPVATVTLKTPIQGRAAYVYDAVTGQMLYEKNPELQLPLASLTKVMTALVASDSLEDDDTVTITDESLHEDGSSGLGAGETWLFRNLLNLTLISSSNDAAHAIAGAAGAIERMSPPGESDDHANVTTFVASMNEKAAELGLAKTYFLNPTGLDETTEKSGAYGSAKDVAKLLAYIIATKPELLEETRLTDLKVTDMAGHEKTAKNTNKNISNLPGLMASKTGLTDLAGGNLAIAFDAGLGHPIVVVVLGSTEDGRLTDVENLVDATLASFTHE